MTTGSYSFHVGEKAGVNVKKWPAIVAPYARADHRRAVGQLLNTGLPFLVLMAALIYCWVEFAYLAFVLAPPAVFLLVRLFIIQYDCGHGSFFASRHPLVLFGLGPFYQFFIRNRIPTGNPIRRREVWGSILGTNIVLAAIVVSMMLTVGGRAFLLAYVPVILLAASTGMWLFYIQHQFQNAYWATGAN